MLGVQKLMETIGIDFPESWDDITEIRLRSGKPAQIRMMNGDEILSDCIGSTRLREIALRLMDGSLYAREQDLSSGFFTMRNGFRVGVCGKLLPDPVCGFSMNEIGSLCIRIAREIRGCAETIATDVVSERLGSALILSPPGMGKTTMIRDLARIVSDSGRCVAIADERSEIAACVGGEPQMDVGLRTDVMDGCPKADAIPMLIRACAPEMIVADEIGSARDAPVLAEAARCGAAIAATAHAESFETACRRSRIGELIATGLFSHIYLLGGAPGRIAERRICRNGEYIIC